MTLTAPHNPPPGGGYMRGSVQCDKRSGWWRIGVYSGGKTVYIYRDPATGSRFYSKEHVEKVLSAMRHDADENAGALVRLNPGLIIDRKWVNDKGA